MANKKEQMQRFARYMREKEGRDLTSQEIALAAKLAGWKLPKPKDPLDILAKEFAEAERDEIKYDEETGDPYRANICYKLTQGDVPRWGDIDKASRDKMIRNVALRREQMIGDGLQLTRDANHWNRINPKEEPVQVELDFTDEVQWKLNAPKEGETGEEAA